MAIIEFEVRGKNAYFRVYRGTDSPIQAMNTTRFAFYVLGRASAAKDDDERLKYNNNLYRDYEAQERKLREEKNKNKSLSDKD